MLYSKCLRNRLHDKWLKVLKKLHKIIYHPRNVGKKKQGWRDKDDIRKSSIRDLVRDDEWIEKVERKNETFENFNVF